MTSGRLRIAVSGPAGAGKTTLVNALAAELSLVRLEEGMRDIYDKQTAFREARKATGTPPEVLERAFAEWKRSYFDWCNARFAAYSRHADFVADRWELDMFGYWLLSLVQYHTDEDTLQLKRIYLEHSRQFDLFVMLPPGDFDIEERNEAGLKRQITYNRSVLTHSCFLGLLSQLPGSTPRYIPMQPESVEKRVADIVAIAKTLRGE